MENIVTNYYISNENLNFKLSRKPEINQEEENILAVRTMKFFRI